MTRLAARYLVARLGQTGAAEAIGLRKVCTHSDGVHYVARPPRTRA